MSKNDIYLASKPRYEILDGLRGVASMIVVAFHLFETYSGNPVHQILNHGYLAVDFFFVLSGFVVGYAYDDRWDRMSTWNFIKRRLVRLHPMVIFGAFFGLLLFYFGDSPMFSLIGQTEWYKPLILFLIACTMIPVNASMDIRGSLVIRHLPKIALAILVAIFACFTIMLCMNIDPLGITGPHQYAAYTVIGGWGIDACQLWIGFIRLLYPFFCGLLISRIGKFIKVKAGYWVCSIIIAICLCMPRVGGTNPDNFWMNGVYEAICILLIFPLVVTIGAGSQVSGKKSFAFCKWMGEISFPLYITHYPLIYMQMSWAAAHKDHPLSMHIFVSVCIFILAILVAWGAYKLYDVPVREWLKSKLFVRVSNENKN